LHAEVDRVATLDVKAGLLLAASAPIVKADLKVTDLTLAAVAGYLAPSGMAPAFSNGSFDGHVEAAMTFGRGITGVAIDLKDWKLQDEGRELLGLDRARIPFELDALANTFHTGEIVLASPRLVAEKTKE